MYRQIKVHKDDWDLQRIFWMDEHSDIIPYQLITVTYGTRSASFLAIHAMIQLVKDEGHKFPLAVNPLLKGTYVDNILRGADTIPANDSFKFTSKPPREKSKLTKRIILSETAQLYDPLGFLAPFIVRAKILLQDIWLDKLSWNEPAPDHIISKWNSVRSELSHVSDLSIPRWLKITQKSTVELHGFSDASQLAMAAVVYVRSTHPDHGTCSTIVCLKSKVAPLKKMSISRLELTAALLFAGLITYVKSNLVVQPTQMKHPLWWIGPQWLTSDESSWPTQSLVYDSKAQQEERLRITLTQTLTIQHDYHWEMIYRHVCLIKLFRVTAVCFRFSQLLRRVPQSPVTFPLTLQELERARIFRIKATQESYSSQEMEQINSNSLPVSHPLARLTAVIETQGVVRVQGRLASANLDEEAKHLAILPQKTHLSRLIIADAHE
ncbi:uncharacterized protein [Chelonus insularis]|uniref:uncharacterized protein n=1 Tax=Chelonus insularis TaxID=460826 RepID=UPI00158AB448|nr:uncharacterized protein LOC118071240 [Chelonus insularis]